MPYGKPRFGAQLRTHIHVHWVHVVLHIRRILDRRCLGNLAIRLSMKRGAADGPGDEFGGETRVRAING